MTALQDAIADLSTKLVPGAANSIGPAKIRDLIINAVRAAAGPLDYFEGTAAPTASDDSAGNAGHGAFSVGSVWVDVTNENVYICVDAATNAAVWKALTVYPTDKINATAAPSANDDEANTSTNGYFSVGSRWIDVTNDKAYVCVDATEGAAVWPEITFTAAGLGEAATLDKSSEAEAEAGVDNTTVMTPLRTAQAIAALSPAAGEHTHAIDDVTDLQTTLDAKVDEATTVTGAGLASGGGALSTNRTIDVTAATAGECRTGSAAKATSVANLWGAAQPVTLTDDATIAVDMATFLNATVTLGGNRTLGNPTNPKPGQSGFIRIVQDGTGSRTLAFGANWKFPGGADPTLSTAAGAVDVLSYVAYDATTIFAMLTKDVR